MTWIVAAASLLATWLNVRGHVACCWIFSCTNAVWATTCFTHGLHAQASLHVTYLGLAIWGIARWRTHPPRVARTPGT